MASSVVGCAGGTEEIAGFMRDLQSKEWDPDQNKKQFLHPELLHARLYADDNGNFVSAAILAAFRRTAR
jgi:hypothetical protein